MGATAHSMQAVVKIGRGAHSGDPMTWKSCKGADRSGSSRARRCWASETFPCRKLGFPPEPSPHCLDLKQSEKRLQLGMRRFYPVTGWGPGTQLRFSQSGHPLLDKQVTCRVLFINPILAEATQQSHHCPLPLPCSEQVSSSLDM